MRLANSIGLIDGGYRGELVGMVDNIYDKDFHIKRGERYFQLVAVDSSPIDFELVKSCLNLAEEKADLVVQADN